MNHKLLPIVGDQVYHENQAKYLTRLSPELKELVTNFKRQALHAYQLSFVHPMTDELLEFEIDLPEDIQELCQALEKL